MRTARLAIIMVLAKAVAPVRPLSRPEAGEALVPHFLYPRYRVLTSIPRGAIPDRSPFFVAVFIQSEGVMFIYRSVKLHFCDVKPVEDPKSGSKAARGLSDGLRNNDSSLS